MDNFLDWKLIPEDRKCYIPQNEIVQVMWDDQSVQEATKNPKEFARYYQNSDGTWYKDIFLYRCLILPVEEVVEKEMWLSPKGPLSIGPVGTNYMSAVKGTAIQTNVDGKPTKLVWEPDTR